MTRLLVAVALVVTGAAAAAAQKPADIVALSGKWLMTLEMEVGTSSPLLMLKQEADKLTGTYTGRYGEYPLTGKVEGRKVEFVVKINAEGTETVMSFAGELTEKDGILRGSANLGGMGDATWLAKRAPAK
jgi:Holliday junction resolvase